MTAKVITKTLISIVFQTFFLTAWSSVLADEASPMLADLGINEAYKDCRLFVFDNKNDAVLFSSVSHFSKLSETYGNQDVHDQCIVGLRSKVLMGAIKFEVQHLARVRCANAKKKLPTTAA
ncbi:hypothetical protein OKW43_002133 [Paraburkholderia sp. WC7.3g]|uniref:hypothetical protein n=1 Tax=Paraburkholderia sp. WC7.3g TaxID=2991070 RepID=UPI003D1E4B4E